VNIKLLVKIVFLVGVLFWVFKDVDIHSFIAVFKNANPYFLVVSFLLYNVTIMLQGRRWSLFLRELMHAESLNKIQFVNFTSMFFDLFVPGKLGSDAQRVLALKNKISTNNVIASLILMRLQGLSLTLLVLVVSMPWLLQVLSEYTGQSLIFYLWVAVSVSIAAIVFFWLILSRFDSLFRHKLNIIKLRFGLIVEQVRVLGSSRLLWFKTSLTYMFYLLMVVSLHYVAAMALNIELSFFMIALPIPLMMISAMLPITIHGRGITEVLAILFWESVLVNREDVVALTITIYFFALAQGLIAGGAWAFSSRYNLK